MFRRFTTGRLARRAQPETERAGGDTAARAVPVARTAADAPAPVLLNPSAPPDYFGPVPNYAASPLPRLDPSGAVVRGTGIRKFVNSLPGLGTARINDLGNHLPVAVPDTITYPGSDYYEIGVQEYGQRLHKDVPVTRLRGYKQLNNGTDGSGHNTVTPPARPFHLGPVIMAHRDRPVRVKFINQLPTGAEGQLFLPVDPTVSGAGTEPDAPPPDAPPPGALSPDALSPDAAVTGAALTDAPVGVGGYPQNRSALHLRGGSPPWISAGSPGQWIAPAGEPTAHPRGAGHAAVPDMPPPGPGAVTLYFPNQCSGRLLWYHDNAEGTARLNVYSGQLGLYLLDDPVERQLAADGVIPAEQIPLVIEDKTFVPAEAQLAAQDPTWDVARWGGTGSLWYPHVYMPRQNPYHESGENPVGRWDYGPWCRPSQPDPSHPPVPNPYHGQAVQPERHTPVATHDAEPGRATEPGRSTEPGRAGERSTATGRAPGTDPQPPLAPGTPTPSWVPEAFLDTPVINGTAYPYLRVRPQAYRFRILNACGDRALNLQLYHARSNAPMWSPDGSLHDGDAGEVPMVEAVRGPRLPPGWPTDGRDGGVPDPDAAGPDWIQIGTEGGLLPVPAVLAQQPIDYDYRRRDATALNVTRHTLLLGPGERADVIVDFSSVPPGSNLILYNDCPAPMPAFDPRYDHYTGGPDQRASGGVPTIPPGWGPNTRTLMQIQVEGVPAPPFDGARLAARLPLAYAASQPPPIVPQPAYDPAFGTETRRSSHVAIHDSALTFTPSGGTGPVALPLRAKVIQQLFEPAYGRRGDTLGVVPPGGVPGRGDGIPLAPIDPPTEFLFPSDPDAPVGSPGDGTQLWRISNGTSDTHFVHFPVCDVQLVNRVGWDGAIQPPDGNELGWKGTVRMDPRQDTIVALRPVLPTAPPFKIGDSVRRYDPAGAPGATAGLTQVNPETGHPAMVTNQVTNLGWEYHWGADLPGHGAYGVRRPVVLRVSPAPPTGLTATPAPGSPTLLPAVGLVWTNNAIRPGANTIVIERATDSSFGADRTVFSVPATVRAFTDSSVTPRTTYHYRVRAENAAAYSAWSNPVTAAVVPLAPVNLSATVPANAPLRATLGWTNRSFATEVEIQRATNPTFTSGLVTVAVPVATGHIDGGIAADTTYYYRVRTGYLGAASPWSNISTAISPGTPAAPAELGATVRGPAGDAVVVTLTWTEDPASVVTGFILQRAADPGFTAEVANLNIVGTARVCTVTDHTRGSTYHYRVRAVNPVGPSAFSDPIAVTTPG